MVSKREAIILIFVFFITTIVLFGLAQVDSVNNIKNNYEINQDIPIQPNDWVIMEFITKGYNTSIQITVDTPLDFYISYNEQISNIIEKSIRNDSTPAFNASVIISRNHRNIEINLLGNQSPMTVFSFNNNSEIIQITIKEIYFNSLPSNADWYSYILIYISSIIISSRVALSAQDHTSLNLFDNKDIPLLSSIWVFMGFYAIIFGFFESFPLTKMFLYIIVSGIFCKNIITGKEDEELQGDNYGKVRTKQFLEFFSIILFIRIFIIFLEVFSNLPPISSSDSLNMIIILFLLSLAMMNYSSISHKPSYKKIKEYSKVPIFNLFSRNQTRVHYSIGLIIALSSENLIAVILLILFIVDASEKNLSFREFIQNPSIRKIKKVWDQKKQHEKTIWSNILYFKFFSYSSLIIFYNLFSYAIWSFFIFLAINNNILPKWFEWIWLIPFILTLVILSRRNRQVLLSVILVLLNASIIFLSSIMIIDSEINSQSLLANLVLTLNPLNLQLIILIITYTPLLFFFPTIIRDNLLSNKNYDSPKVGHTIICQFVAKEIFIVFLCFSLLVIDNRGDFFPRIGLISLLYAMIQFIRLFFHYYPVSSAEVFQGKVRKDIFYDWADFFNYYSDKTEMIEFKDNYSFLGWYPLKNNKYWKNPDLLEREILRMREIVDNKLSI